MFSSIDKVAAIKVTPKQIGRFAMKALYSAGPLKDTRTTIMQRCGVIW